MEVARRLFNWVDDQGDLTEWYGSDKKDGSFQAGYGNAARYLFPFALSGYGRVEIHFQYMLRRPPFDREAMRRVLLDKLNTIPGVDIPPEMLTKRPSIALAVLTQPGALEQFTGALEWAFETAAAPTQP